MPMSLDCCCFLLISYSNIWKLKSCLLKVRFLGAFSINDDFDGPSHRTEMVMSDGLFVQCC